MIQSPKLELPGLQINMPGNPPKLELCRLGARDHRIDAMIAGRRFNALEIPVSLNVGEGLTERLVNVVNECLIAEKRRS